MKDFRKKYFKDEYVFLFLAAAIVAVGVFGYSQYSFRETAKEDTVDNFEDSLPNHCENGDWIEFPDLEDASRYENFSGHEKFAYDEKKNVFMSGDGARTFSTDKNYSLFFFMDRATQVDGYKLKDDEIYVKRIKCVGEEADKTVVEDRRKVMGYIAANINSLALEKAPQEDWQVETFYFANSTDVYVQYESQGSFMDEAPYDSHLWLVRVSDLGNDIPTIKTLAYIQEDPEDASKNIVKQGEDLYKDAKNMTVYEFDEGVNQWVLQ